MSKLTFRIITYSIIALSFFVYGTYLYFNTADQFDVPKSSINIETYKFVLTSSAVVALFSILLLYGISQVGKTGGKSSAPKLSMYICIAFLYVIFAIHLIFSMSSMFKIDMNSEQFSRYFTTNAIFSFAAAIVAIAFMFSISLPRGQKKDEIRKDA